MSKKRRKENGIRLTALGLGVVEGEVVTRRWAARETDTGKLVFIYSPTEEFKDHEGRNTSVASVAAKHFKTIATKIRVEPAGRIEWMVIDKGTPNERAVQKLIWYPPYDDVVLIDRQYDQPKGKKK